MDKYVKMLLMLVIGSTVGGCMHLQELKIRHNMDHWLGERQEECEVIASYNNAGSELALYPESPVVDEKLKHSTAGWKLKQRVVESSNPAYNCVCTKAVPHGVATASKVDWDLVAENCLPLMGKELTR